MNTSCPMRERFLEANSQRTERKLAGPGRPGTVDGLVAGGALGGAAPSLGRARLPCRARWVHHPASRVPIGALAPPAAPSPRAVRGGLANLGRIAPRECKTMPRHSGALAALARVNPDSRRLALRSNSSGLRVRAEEARPGMTEFPRKAGG